MGFASRDFFTACSAYAAKKSLNLKVGDRCARGFADLGFEEFIMLPGERLLSLFSGQISAYNQLDSEKNHLVPLLTMAQLISELHMHGASDIAINILSPRKAQLVFTNKNQKIEYTGDDIELILIKALLCL